MVDIIISVAAKVSEYLVAPIGRQINYLYGHDSNFRKLKDEVQKLKDANAEVQDKVDDAHKNVKRIKTNVEKWQDSVNKIIEEAEQFIEEKEKSNNRCFKGLDLNLIASYKHSKEASEKVKAVAKLLQEEKEFGEVARPIIPEEIWLRSNKGYEAFESRMSTLKNILNALNDADVNMIGVYGMGGIGKTTLVKEVGRQAKKDELFNEVVFVEICDTQNIEKIQEVIADKLGLEFHNQTERARKLYARLKNEKKILIILDNIWADDLDLEKVGIPSGDDHKGCKLLLITRDHHVLESMGAKSFPINILNEKEGWSLFKKMVGDCIKNRELKPIAIDVVKECGGLPIAIVTVAKALRNKSACEWNDALRQLRRPSPTNFTGVLEKTYSKIELSYDFLKSEELKKSFLLCSLMTHDASISELFKYVMGLDLLQGDITKMEEARNRLDKLVRELKDSCLLLDNDTDETFSMHDVVRAVAISIASRDNHIIIRQNGNLIELPDEDKLEKCTKISLLHCNIGELPEVLECPQLELFNIHTNESSFRIPDNFFARTEKLKVLSLIRVQLLPLPSSLHLLLNLQTLCLDYSRVEDIVVIGDLKKLKILSLRGSKIKQLPGKISQLTQLRLLDLSNCSQLKIIAPNVISNLSRLEELYMGNCSIQWEVEGLNVEKSKVSLNELKNLSRLTTLEIDIEDDKILPKGLFTKKLDRYKISIGDKWDWFMMKSKASRTLKLKLNSSICLEELQGVIKNVEDLYLDEFKGVKNILYELDEEGFPQLKHLQIENSLDLLYIVDSTDLVPCDGLPCLESLFLNRLINLEKISHGQLAMESFCKLKFIRVCNCGKLENIFSFSNMSHLPQLQDIKVMNCQNMKEIFYIEGQDDVSNNKVTGNIEFLKLRSLFLCSLPQLTSFYSQVKTSTTPQKRLKELKIESQSDNIILKDEFDTSTSFFNAKDFFPNLEVLQLTGINSGKIWHNQLPTMSSCYQSLTRLILSECPKLEHVFSATTVKSLEQLQHLDISSCIVLKEIIANEGGTKATAKFVFPRITFLRLEDLPELITFYPGIHISEWPMLKRLEVSRCDKVRILSSECLSFHDFDRESQLEINSTPKSCFLINRNLEELTLGRKEIMMIRQGQFPKEFFCILKVLEVHHDESTNIPIEILQIFKILEKLKLTYGSYKEIFSRRQNEKHVGTLTQIKNLEIYYLKDLKYLWKQDSILDSIFENLEILSVNLCGRLVNIVPFYASFRNLTVLKVENCSGLINLATSLTAKSLVQLREMEIRYCNMMVEILKDEEDEVRDEIVFGKLKLLYLEDLETLTSFCSGNYTFKFPALKELRVIRCPKMKTFSKGILYTPRLQKVKQYRGSDYKACWDGDLNTTIQQLHKKMVNSNSEELTLSGEDIRMIWQGQFLEHYSFGLKVLEVIKDESTHVPIGILQKFNDLKKLILKVSSYEEIFSYEDVEKHAGRLTQIKTLEMRGLFGLKYLWKQNSDLNSILQNLEILKVYNCHNLTYLMPPSTSFKNLTTLSVEYCDGLINLVTALTAKSLVQLEEVTIGYCEMMMEIVATEGGIANEEIVFNKLKSLSLYCLESITSFCSGSYTFKFPALEELKVDGCPKMKTFTGGIISTPRLQKVYCWYDNEGCWEGELNTTIQQLHKKVNVQSSEKDSGQC